MRHSALDRARTVAVSGTRRAARMVRRAARPVASRRPGRLAVLARRRGRGWVRLAEAHRLHHRYGGEPYGMLFPVVPVSLRARAAPPSRDRALGGPS